jgi:hypothetical protein
MAEDDRPCKRARRPKELRCNSSPDWDLSRLVRLLRIDGARGFVISTCGRPGARAAGSTPLQSRSRGRYSLGRAMPPAVRSRCETTRIAAFEASSRSD